MNAIQKHFAGLRALAKEQYDAACKAAQEAAEKQVRRAQAEAAAKLSKTLAALAANEQRMLERAGRRFGPSKIKIVRNALNGEFKRVRQLIEETGLTGDDVSRVLSQKSLRKIMDIRGKPGSLEYRLKKRGPAPEKIGTTAAILGVLENNPNGIEKSKLIEAVEKLTDSESTDHLRTAIRSTLRQLESRRRVSIDEDGICTPVPA